MPNAVNNLAREVVPCIREKSNTDNPVDQVYELRSRLNPALRKYTDFRDIIHNRVPEASPERLRQAGYVWNQIVKSMMQIAKIIVATHNRVFNFARTAAEIDINATSRFLIDPSTKSPSFGLKDGKRDFGYLFETHTSNDRVADRRYEFVVDVYRFISFLKSNDKILIPKVYVEEDVDGSKLIDIDALMKFGSLTLPIIQIRITEKEGSYDFRIKLPGDEKFWIIIKVSPNEQESELYSLAKSICDSASENFSSNSLNILFNDHLQRDFDLSSLEQDQDPSVNAIQDLMYRVNRTSFQEAIDPAWLV